MIATRLDAFYQQLQTRAQTSTPAQPAAFEQSQVAPVAEDHELSDAPNGPTSGLMAGRKLASSAQSALKFAGGPDDWQTSLREPLSWF